MENQKMTGTLKEQLIAWCLKHGYPLPFKREEDAKYEGLEECRKNVIRTNNSRKLQYCKA